MSENNNQSKSNLSSIDENIDYKKYDEELLNKILNKYTIAFNGNELQDTREIHGNSKNFNPFDFAYLCNHLQTEKHITLLNYGKQELKNMTVMAVNKLRLELNDNELFPSEFSITCKDD